jgi:hypothetical protein
MSSRKIQSQCNIAETMAQLKVAANTLQLKDSYNRLLRCRLWSVIPEVMRNSLSKISAVILVVSVLWLTPTSAAGQSRGDRVDEEPFGPVVRAYLGYLRNEQEVVDDRVSRREVSQSYYRRNSNRIRALRQMALRIARESRNDYLPELEAVSRDEMGLLFERPPRPEALREGEVLRRTFRFLGVVRSGESFYIFARLDPYEQSELNERQSSEPSLREIKTGNTELIRAKRVTSP